MSKESLPRLYGFAVVTSLIVILVASILGGWSAVVPIMILAVIEITFSFDNAVINSEVLSGMSRLWQTLFLTVGIAVAVFGVRLILPIALVSATSGHSMQVVFDSALHHPEVYATELHEAYPLIAAFGGVFLLMIGLRFFGEKRQVRWLNTVEAPLGEFNQPWWVAIVGALGAIGLLFIMGGHEPKITLAAALGAITFIIIKGVSEWLMKGAKHGMSTGHAAFLAFIYLEVLDATFSFDGVVGAFAITQKVFLIAAGLGIGALFVRSMTVHLLRRGTLMQFRYLVHGAHYAILALAVVLLVSVKIELPEVVTGLIGISFISAAVFTSHLRNLQEKTSKH